MKRLNNNNTHKHNSNIHKLANVKIRNELTYSILWSNPYECTTKLGQTDKYFPKKNFETNVKTYALVYDENILDMVASLTFIVLRLRLLNAIFI